MEQLPSLLLVIVYGGLFILLLYFIFKRIQDKKNEDFEKRDN